MTFQEIINSTRSATTITQLGKYKDIVNLNATQKNYVADMDMQKRM
jgi:ABC-type enterochelin transport system substrate-binding protein